MRTLITQCDVCGRSFLNVQQCKEHITVAHGKIEREAYALISFLRE